MRTRVAAEARARMAPPAAYIAYDVDYGVVMQDDATADPVASEKLRADLRAAPGERSEFDFGIAVACGALCADRWGAGGDRRAIRTRGRAGAATLTGTRVASARHMASASRASPAATSVAAPNGQERDRP